MILSGQKYVPTHGKIVSGPASFSTMYVLFPNPLNIHNDMTISVCLNHLLSTQKSTKLNPVHKKAKQNLGFVCIVNLFLHHLFFYF